MRIVFGALLLVSCFFGCSGGPDRPPTLAQEGTGGPISGGGGGTTTTSTPEAGIDPTPDSGSGPALFATHAYAWCKAPLDPNKVYYIGHSMFVNEVQAIFDLSKPGEFCLGLPTLDLPVMRANGSLVFNGNFKLYEWTPDEAVKFVDNTNWSQRSGVELLGNDKEVSIKCPAGATGIGSDIQYDRASDSAVHSCGGIGGNYREDGTSWDVGTFITKYSHPNGARLGTDYPTLGGASIALVTAGGTVVKIPSLSNLSSVRVKAAAFHVVDQAPSTPFAASLWEVSLEGVATKLGDYADLTGLDEPYTPVIDVSSNNAVIAWRKQTFIKRPLKPGNVEVIWDKAATTNPAYDMAATAPVMPIQLSANGGLFTGP